MLRRAIVVALAVPLVGAPAAPAAIIGVGPGKQPDVAVGSGGIAHIVWNTGDDTGVRYCAVAADGASCSSRGLSPVSDDSSARPYVFASGSTVRVLTRRCCIGGSHALLFTSGNGGQDFGVPASVGTLNPSGDAAFGPGTGISMVTDSLVSTYFQRVPADGSAAASAEPSISSQYTYHGAVTVTGGRPLVAFDNLTNTAFTYANGGDPNSGSSWPTPAAVGAGVEPHLASGPSGTYLLTRASSPNGDTRLEVRRFDGASFGAPHEARYAQLYSDGSIGAAALAEDPTGRLHVVWREGGGNPTRLMYSSSADGATWTEPLEAAKDSSVQNLRLSVGADGNGLAVWDHGTEGQVNAVRVPPPLPPTATFTYSPQGICTGTLRFDGSSSQPGPGGSPIVNYHWRIEDAEVEYAKSGGGWFVPPSSTLALLVPRVTEFDTGSDPHAQATFQWLEVYQDHDLTLARPPADIRLTVTDSGGFSNTVRRGVAFLHPSVPYGASLSKLRPPCPHLDPMVPVRLASSVARIGARGSLSVYVRCPDAGLTCLGNLQLSQIRAASSRTRRRAPVVLGKQLYVVPGGKKGRIKVKLNRRGRALLRRHRLRRVRAVFSTHQFGSTSRNRVTTLRLRR